ncbi:hypothetical protein M3210_04920 [Oceanobacillus luteolus]|uniref:Uncharacterized protein n=1 Tax=Oceanobacillus luteolus TaxID=1274358 RepID=A0ABW4HSR0_9BACI|nr:hypothetical protein [Oceanobacillus luteolus]MCM3739608.1 hypothetical protein [Oceanobacillus luteolus]
MKSRIVRNCRLCQDLLVDSPFMLCATCLHDSEQVWNFIRKNPFVSVHDIVVATRIEYLKVERMINYGNKRNQRSTIENKSNSS